MPFLTNCSKSRAARTLTKYRSTLLGRGRELEEDLSYPVQVLPVTGVALQAGLVVLAQDSELGYSAPETRLDYRDCYF